MIGENWGQHRKFRGSVATFKNFEAHGNLCFELFAKSKGIWPIDKSIRNIAGERSIAADPFRQQPSIIMIDY